MVSLITLSYEVESPYCESVMVEVRRCLIKEGLEKRSVLADGEDVSSYNFGYSTK